MSINNSLNLTNEQIQQAPSGRIPLGDTTAKPIVVNAEEDTFPSASNQSQAPRITERTRKVTRPNISGSGNYVIKSNPDRHLEAYEARKKAEALAEAEYVSPEEALNKQVQYLTRAVKTLQKEVKRLTNEG